MPDKLKTDYFGMNLVWFFGVVEDRNDPIKLGRVRVRCHTWHTEDRILLPTSSLPWAQCIQPITSAATSGIGRSPTGLVEGSWVFGFFMDGQGAQKPMIMGSLAGIPTEEPDASKGFNGFYPDILNEPDIPRQARGQTESNLIADDGLPTKLEDRKLRDRQYEDKIESKINDIFEAVAPSVKGITDKSGTDYLADSPKWSEPNPRYGGENAGTNGVPDRFSVDPDPPFSKYPWNHVHATESGHLFEVDDSVGAERIHQYHRTGTFVEIVANGNRSTKVVGKDYEIVIRDKKVFIKGDMTVSIDGDAKMLVKGNHYTEVAGDQYVTVYGDRITKIQGSDIKEVMTDHSVNIQGVNTLRVGANNSILIQGNHSEDIQGNSKEFTNGNYGTKVFGNSDEVVFGTHNSISVGKRNIGTGGDIDVTAADTAKIHSGKAMNIDTSIGDITVVSGGVGKKIDLNP